MENVKETATISITRYNELLYKEQKLKKKFDETFIQVFHQYMLFYNKKTLNEGTREIVEKAEKIDKENKILKEEVNSLKLQNNMLLTKTNKKSWWK